MFSRRDNDALQDHRRTRTGMAGVAYRECQPEVLALYLMLARMLDEEEPVGKTSLYSSVIKCMCALGWNTKVKKWMR